MPRARALGSLLAGAGLAAAFSCLGAACGLDTFGNGDFAGDPSDAVVGPAADTRCNLGCTGDDGSLSPPPPEDAPGGTRPDAPAATSSSDASADGASCSDTCVMQTCGIPCNAGSVCQLYIGCLVLCGFSDASDCTTQCGATYPTGPLLAACAIACGATCASGSSGAGDAGGSSDAAGE